METANRCPEVQRSAIQSVFVVRQEYPGVLTYPGPEHMINPTGDATVNQTIPTTPSREKSPGLNVKDNFQGIAEAATVNAPFYLRPTGYDKSPQGGDAILAVIGARGEQMTAELAADISASDTTLTINNVSSKMPPRGIIKIVDELILYKKIKETSTPGTFELSMLTRGYVKSVAVEALSGEDVHYKSWWAKQDPCPVEVSVWVQTDSLLQAVEGALSVSCPVPMSETDAVEFQVTFNGKHSYASSPDILAAAAIVGAKTIEVSDARNFFVGERIKNRTKKDDNAGAGYAVTHVDRVANTVTVATGVAMAWATDDVIMWHMPSGAVTGRATENRDTTLLFDKEPMVLKSGTLNIQTPVNSVTQIGSRFPDIMVSTQRTSNITFQSVMKAFGSAVSIDEGLEGKEVSIDIECGKTPGYCMAISMPRVKLTGTNVTHQSPVVLIDTQGTPQDTELEDSMYIIME